LSNLTIFLLAAMSTSGQKRAGQSHTQEDYFSMLKRVRKYKEAETIEPHSAVGLEVTEIIERAASRVQRVRIFVRSAEFLR
jgi:hypothetical protein